MQPRLPVHIVTALLIFAGPVAAQLPTTELLPVVTEDPMGNPVDKRHPWNQTTVPRPQKRDLNDKYTWVMSPRWNNKRTGEDLALDTGC